MQFSYPDPKMMYISMPQGGADIEGRKHRKGGNSMEIGSLTARHEVYDVNWRDIHVPEIPNQTVREVNYKVDISTFIPLYLIGDIKRYETIGFWLLSYQELLRHLALASIFTTHPFWPGITTLRDSLVSSIQQILYDWHDIILTEGDTSIKQWRRYVHDHVKSSTPWKDGKGKSIKWQQIEDNARWLVECHSSTNKWIPQYINHYKELDFSRDNLIKAALTYASVRARPGEYDILKQATRTVTLYCRKWRDRKVGGVIGASQMTYPVYQNEAHESQEKLINNWIEKTTGFKTHSFTLEGPQMLLDMHERDEIYVYDVKTAEKLVGLLLPFSGYAVDLSDVNYPAEFAPEMYSGVGPTKPLNDIGGAILAKGLNELGESDIGECWFYADNWAFDKPLPENPYFTEEESFVGYLVKKGKYGPPSLVTDNPDHRLIFNGRNQIQTQRVQYIMRPFMTVMLNSIFSPNSCNNFLKYVVNKKLLNKNSEEDVRKDYMKRAILSKDIETHHNILDEFPDEVEKMEQFFYLQKTDPDFSSSLTVYNP
jgi:hypothetical protein